MVTSSMNLLLFETLGQYLVVILLLLWKIQWLNVQSTWEDKYFIKATFSGFYCMTPKEWL